MTETTAQQLIDMCIEIRQNHKNLTTSSITDLMTAITNLPASEVTKACSAKIFITLQGTYKVYMRGHLKKLLAKEPKFINTFVAILGSCMNNAMFTDNQHQGFIAFLRDILEQMDKEKPSSSRAPGDKKKVLQKKESNANEDNERVELHTVVEAIQKVKIEELETLANAAETTKKRRPRKARVAKTIDAEDKNAEINSATQQI